MREIKFRLWDKEENEFTLDFHISNKGNIVAIDTGKEFMEIADAPDLNNRFIIEQYTGLKDKNGKEIWEGDILEFMGGTCDYLPNGIYGDQKYIIGDKMIVQSLLSGFTLAGLNMIDCNIPNRIGKVDNYTFWNHARSLKIIGNIHENPELIK